MLRVIHLSIGVQGCDELLVNDVSFEIHIGEILGVVGESGSGKSMTALAILGLLPKGIQVKQGQILFQGENLLDMDAKQRREWMGDKIAMIFQEPMTSLNPVHTIGKQIEEMLLLHTELSKQERKAMMEQMLQETGLLQYPGILKQYPHELSGGMRQRVMIAIAMILCPSLLICDEPTTALDVKVQEQILELIQALNRGKRTAVLFISHDIGVIHTICERAVVMYQGQIVEQNTVEDLFNHPTEQYTKELMEALPSADKKIKRSLEDNKERVVLSLQNVTLAYENKIIVEKLSFSLYEGEILGMVGPSGCGKSTVARAITGLIPVASGKLDTMGTKPQMVFQDPYSSLNPAYTVEWILEEPMKIRRCYSKDERKMRVREVIVEVGLDESYLKRRINELSGGQRQRISLAAALTCYPKVLVLDEPVSALDVTVQDKVLRLLAVLRDKYQMSYLLISHDEAVLDQLCDRMISPWSKQDND